MTLFTQREQEQSEQRRAEFMGRFSEEEGSAAFLPIRSPHRSSTFDEETKKYKNRNSNTK